MCKVKKELTEWIPLIYVPIPNRSNPVLVVPTGKRVIVEASIEGDGGGIEIEGDVSDEVAAAVASFYQTLRKETASTALMRLSIQHSGKLNETFMYVALTNAMLESMGGPLDRRIVAAAEVVDAEVGVDDSVYALRKHVFHAKPYIWRRGEGEIELTSHVVAQTEVVGTAELNYVEPLDPDVVTHLAGIAAIEGFRTLSAKDKEFRRALRLSNSIWHLIYGIPLPREEGKCFAVIKSLTHADLLEVELVGGRTEDS